MAGCGRALVIGASGVTGTPLVEHLLAADWRVLAISRRAPILRRDVPVGKLRHLAIDLADRTAIARAMSAFADVSHVYYCAFNPDPGSRLPMLANVLTAIETAAPHLANVYLMQGTKYYGCHLGPFAVPARETDPRVAAGDFYYSEEDWMRRRQEGKRWKWTALRPHAVCGYAAGNPLNLAAAIGVYAAICKALGATLPFPASEACFISRYNVMDAELLARAAIWCSTTPGCGNQAFNVNNGDVFAWREMWPRLAAHFGLQAAGPCGASLCDFFAAHRSTWRALAERHRLRPFPYEALPRWVQGDYRAPNSRLACEYDVIADLGKLRAHGFDERVDSAQMFIRLFARFEEERVIPVP